MSQHNRIVDPYIYIHAIWGGLLPEWDAAPDFELLDATRLDHLRLAFLFPQRPQDLWQGLRKPGASDHARPMTRVGETGHMDSDGVEYEADAPQIFMGDDGRVRFKTMPWRRTTPKRETSSQIRAAKHLEAALANATQTAPDWLA